MSFLHRHGSTLFLEMGSLSGSGCPACPRDPPVSTFPSQCFKCTPPHLTFYLGCGDWTPVLMLSRQALSQLISQASKHFYLNHLNILSTRILIFNLILCSQLCSLLTKYCVRTVLRATLSLLLFQMLYWSWGLFKWKGIKDNKLLVVLPGKKKNSIYFSFWWVCIKMPQCNSRNRKLQGYPGPEPMTSTYRLPLQAPFFMVVLDPAGSQKHLGSLNDPNYPCKTFTCVKSAGLPLDYGWYRTVVCVFDLPLAILNKTRIGAGLYLLCSPRWNKCLANSWCPIDFRQLSGWMGSGICWKEAENRRDAKARAVRRQALQGPNPGRGPKPLFPPRPDCVEDRLPPGSHPLIPTGIEVMPILKQDRFRDGSPRGRGHQALVKEASKAGTLFSGHHAF